MLGGGRIAPNDPAARLLYTILCFRIANGAKGFCRKFIKNFAPEAWWPHPGGRGRGYQQKASPGQTAVKPLGADGVVDRLAGLLDIPADALDGLAGCRKHAKN